MRIEIPVSVGELVDRVTILRIKDARIQDPDRRAHVRAELDKLEVILDAALPADDELAATTAALAEVNTALWEIEDELREYERAGDFGDRFIAAARQVYRLNDERFRLKRSLDERYGSEISEQKSYSRDQAGA